MISVKNLTADSTGLRAPKPYRVGVINKEIMETKMLVGDSFQDKAKCENV